MKLTLTGSRTKTEKVPFEVPEHYVSDDSKRGKLVDLLLETYTGHKAIDIRDSHHGLYAEDADTIDAAIRHIKSAYAQADDILELLGIDPHA